VNDDELVYRRVFRAPREVVWRCLTEPAELARFWGPSGMATPIDGIVVELHPGGRFETLMLGEHGSYRMHTTSTLDDLGGDRTAVVIHQRNVPETMRMPEARAGFLTSLDKLEEHLAHLVQGERS